MNLLTSRPTVAAVLVAATLLLCLPVHSGEPGSGPALTRRAGDAINHLGLQLIKHDGSGRNSVLSPYSIQSVMTMVYAGSDGQTRAELAQHLGLEGDEAALHESFHRLSQDLHQIAASSGGAGKLPEGTGRPPGAIQIQVANRLYAQRGFAVRESFLKQLETAYGAPLLEIDFQGQADQARVDINQWIAEQTEHQIVDLISPGGLSSDTALLAVNAIYFKAQWYARFPMSGTAPRPFHVGGREKAMTPTMQIAASFNYRRLPGGVAVGVPYENRELQFLVILPDAVDGLPAMMEQLTGELLASCGPWKAEPMTLRLPKFTLRPPSMNLSATLRSLGVRTAFDIPKGSANFERIAPRTPDNYLALSGVLHKAFIEVDELGTEAAAASATGIMIGANGGPTKRIEINVDRPFFFAIQHRASGACLFMGCVSDPR